MYLLFFALIPFYLRPALWNLFLAPADLTVIFFPKESASSTEKAEGSITSFQFHHRLCQNPFFHSQKQYPPCGNTRRCQWPVQLKRQHRNIMILNSHADAAAKGFQLNVRLCGTP